MQKINFNNRGQRLTRIIIVLAVVGLMGWGLYYYFSKQIPEITEKPGEEDIVEPGEGVIIPPLEEELPKEEVTMPNSLSQSSLKEPQMEITARSAGVSYKNSLISTVFGVFFAHAQER